MVAKKGRKLLEMPSSLRPFFVKLNVKKMYDAKNPLKSILLGR